MLGRRLSCGGRHAARFYTWEGLPLAAPTLFLLNSPGPQPELEAAWGYLTLFRSLCRDFVIGSRAQRADCAKSPRSLREISASSAATRRGGLGARKLSGPAP